MERWSTKITMFVASHVLKAETTKIRTHIIRYFVQTLWVDFLLSSHQIEFIGVVQFSMCIGFIHGTESFYDFKVGEKLEKPR